MQIEITLNLLTIFDILSVSTAFMLGLLFLTSRLNNKANVFLGLFLWSLSLEVFNVLLEMVINVDWEILNTNLLTIVFLLFYLLRSINHNMSIWQIVLFFPFILDYLFGTPHFIEYIFNISILIYMLKIVQNHQLKIVNYYSNIESKTLSWIKNIVIIFLLFNVFWIIEDVIGLQNEIIADYFAFCSTLLTLSTIYWIGYNGFTQSEIFAKPINRFEVVKDEKQELKPIEDDLEMIESTKLVFSKITQIIEQERIFIKKDITIRSLSKQLSVNERELSKMIKIHTKNNFHHYINKFRVEEFKKLLTSSKVEHMSLLGLAFEAGFKSKSTFYAAFKTVEKITPKQYQNQLKKSE